MAIELDICILRRSLGFISTSLTTLIRPYTRPFYHTYNELAPYSAQTKRTWLVSQVNKQPFYIIQTTKEKDNLCSFYSYSRYLSVLFTPIQAQMLQKCHHTSICVWAVWIRRVKKYLFFFSHITSGMLYDA